MKKIKYVLVALPILWVIGCTKNDELEKEIAENSKKEVIQKNEEDPKADETKDNEGKTEENSEDTSQNDDANQEGNSEENSQNDNTNQEGNSEDTSQNDDTNQEGNTQNDEITFTITFDTDGENTPTPIKVKKGDTFITLPQPTRDNREFMGWTKKKDALTDFAPGTPLEEVQEDMTLYANWRIIDTSIGGASKNFRNETVFVKGVPVPKESDWQRVRGHDRKNIDWQKGYKWYDTDQFQDDLCWAATASNIIQWWLDQNAEYIKRYGKYNQPHEHRSRFDSDLFQFYKANFKDTGNRPDLAVLWYLKGLSTKEGAGFFKEVFENIELKRNTFSIYKSEFNIMLDDAFKNGKAISIVAGGHAFTMWGAHFDDEGYVDKIYYTDSADRSREEGIGLRYIDVVYREEYGVLKPFIPSSVKGSYIPVGSISTFSLGQDVWEKYLTKHNK